MRGSGEIARFTQAGATSVARRFYAGHYSYENGKMHGQGWRVLHDSSVYQGNYDNGEMHGKGKLVEPDGAIYEGEWSCGDAQGLATERWPNGSKCEGEYASVAARPAREGVLHVGGW